MNPYLPEYEYIPDGEPHVFGSRVYVYGSHDRFDGEQMCMNDYVCYSADISDLANWRYEGVIYRSNQDPRMAAGNRHLWAPDVIQGKDGKFYLYYCPDGDAESIGVAICDTPAGKYMFYGLVQDSEGIPIGKRPQDTDPFDPAVFMDDDGTVYLYSGNGPLLKEYPPQFAHLAPTETAKGCAVMVLGDDMLTIKAEPKLLIPHVKQADGTSFEQHPFFEASSVRKIRGKYYLVYSSNKLHELCYAVSDYPDRGFVYGGVLISNVDMLENNESSYAKNAISNNHGSILELNENYYIFYHRATNNKGHSRQGCAEQLHILEDGKILQAEMTSNGMEPPFQKRGRYPASCVCHLYRLDRKARGLLEQVGNDLPYLTQDGPDYQPEEGESAPRQYIANLRDRSVAEFRYFEVPGVKQIRLTLRGDDGGVILLRQNPGSEPFARIVTNRSDGWSDCTVSLSESVDLKSLCICYEGSGTVELLEFWIL